MTTLGEAARESSTRSWTLTGKTMLVKVIGESALPHVKLGDGPETVRLSGYFTQAKYLYGLTAGEMERALGLPPHRLAAGAYVYAFSRLPAVDEIEFKYSLAFPDGLIPTREEFDSMLDRRDSALAGRSSEPNLYPPGGTHIPQWKLTPISRFGGITGQLMQKVEGAAKFLRLNGSPQRYQPHTRPVNWGRIL